MYLQYNRNIIGTGEKAFLGLEARYNICFNFLHPKNGKNISVDHLKLL